jgi:C4-dicarboxylate transporter, DctM subunit
MIGLPVADQAAPRPANSRALFGAALILVPIGLIAVCLLSKLGLLQLGQGMRAAMIFLLLIALMLTGMPISIALGLTVLTFLFTLTQVPIESVALKLFTGIEKFEIMAIPFFILAGNFLTHGGVARRMIAFATSMVGHWHGGLALAGVMACALFAAVSGSSPATVVAIGSVILPAMVAQGFPNRFGAGVITTSGSLGILIPPSIPMVIFAVSTNTSVGKLFMAGVVPGLLLAFCLGCTTWLIARKNGYPRLAPIGGRSPIRATMSAGKGLLVCMPLILLVPAFVVASLIDGARGNEVLFASVMRWARWLALVQGLWIFVGYGLAKWGGYGLGLRHEALKVWRSFWDSVWGLLLIIIVIGGIYTGFFTPTEAAAMSAVYAFIVAVFVYGDMGMKDVPRVLLDSANMSAMLLYIITNAVLFSFLMTHENIPQAMAEWMIGQGLGWVGFLLLVNILLLLAGNVMEPSSIILIMAPILFPVAIKLGIDPVHFGILIVVNMEVGLCHPPVGLNLYVASGIAKMGITELTVAVWPWLLTMLCFLVVVTYWPALSLWLPRLLGMM